MKNQPKVCVIGAGCSGITSLKNLIQAGVQDVVCFEQNDQVGGNWIYSEKESHSSVCETTHIISSKKLSEYMDFPMPDDYPDYPSHRQVLDYFQSYARHFKLLPYIRFNTSVAKAEKTEEGKWKVFLENGEKHFFDFLFIANGHHSVPRMPELPGEFKGDLIHAHSYKNNRAFKDKKVLVIGAGNSGCDCAVEISRVAEKVTMSIRRPNYIIPKFFLGKPADTFNKKMLWLPRFIAEPIRRLSLWFNIGKYKDYGLEEPNYPITAAHPTLNSELLYRIRHGKVKPVKGITKVDGKKVHFKGGESEDFDVIVAATGYRITFPFFEKDFIDYEDAKRIPLYMRMFHPEHRSLIFVGLFQPQGAIWPLSDYQAKLAANYVTGRWQMPENIDQLAEKDADFISKEFIQSKRHAIEVHYHPFLKRLKAQLPKNAPEWKETRTVSKHKLMVTAH